MIFLAGWALWLLSLGLIVAVIYFLKRQALPVSVSTLFLWRGIEQTPKSALRLHWTHLLGLFLQLLALAALITGLAHPVIYTSARGGPTLAILIDGSASMRTMIAPEGPTRYQVAVDSILELLSSSPTAIITLIQAQDHSILLSSPTSDQARLRSVLTDSGPTYQGDARPSQLISLLQSQAPNGFDRVVYFTDHSPPFDETALGWEVQLVRGEASPQNLAITRFSVREHPNRSSYDLYLEAWNSSDEWQRVPLELTADDQLIDARWIELAPRQVSSFVFNYDGSRLSRLTARLVTDTVRDDWTDDNIRYASPPEPRPWKILWVGDSNFYLERFLRLSGQTDLVTRTAWDDTILTSDYDAILLNQTELPKPMSGRFLLLQSSAPPWVRAQETVPTDDMGVEVKLDHPMLAGIDPKDWRLLRISEAQVDPRGVALLTVGEIPLLYLYETTGLRLVYLGADLGASNLGLSVDFPILMYRVLSWLAPRAEEERNVEIGQELPLIGVEGPVRITDPQSRSCDFPSEETRCGLVEQPGFYELSRNGTVQIYAANTPSEESLSLPTDAKRSDLSVPAQRESPSLPSIAERNVAHGLWPYLLVAGLFLLILELLYFDRSLFHLPIPRLRRRAM